MLCNVCKQNEAKVHLTKIVGDKMHKVDLCEDCSKEKGVEDPTSYSSEDSLLGMALAALALVNVRAAVHATGGAGGSCAIWGDGDRPRAKRHRVAVPDRWGG